MARLQEVNNINTEDRKLPYLCDGERAEAGQRYPGEVEGTSGNDGTHGRLVTWHTPVPLFTNSAHEWHM